MNSHAVNSALHLATDLALHAAKAYRRNEQWFRRRADARCVSSYDDRAAAFGGEEVPPSVHADKALRLLCKAELETAGGMREQWRSIFSSTECEAFNWILSLMVHGEAYALYVSSSLVPFAAGTSSKLSLSVQVLDEAKHYTVLRSLAESLPVGTKPLHTSARIFLESIARAAPHDRLFGLNVIMESFAMEFFLQFLNSPGFGSILHKFLADETRHCTFPQNYARQGAISEVVRNSLRSRVRRTRLVLLALPVVFDYQPHFEILGVDGFEFFSRVLARALRLAEASDMPLALTAEQYLALANVTINSYVRAVERSEYCGFRDYCGLGCGQGGSDAGPRWYWNLYQQAVEAMNVPAH
jgi:hypothetical protein